MRILFLSIFLLFTECLSQTLEEYSSLYKKEEVVSSIKRPCFLTTKDLRWSQNYSINKDSLVARIVSRLNNSGVIVYTDSYTVSDIPALVIEIEIEYLNFYESSAGNLFGKAMVKFLIKDKSKPLFEESFRITSDQVVKGANLSDYEDDEYKQLFTTNSSIIIDQIISRSENKLFNIIEKLSTKYIKITSAGKSKLTSNQEQDRKKAIIDALKNGCERALGISLVSKTQVVDFGNVSDTTTTKLDGIVLSYEVKPKSEIKTTDGFICLLINAIIVNNK